MDGGTPLQNQAGAPVGNTNALKFDTPEKRQAFCKAYCDWIADGWADEGFCYEGSTIRTFRDYLVKYPIDFPSDMIAAAQAQRFHFWEKMGRNGSLGVPTAYKAGKEIKYANKFNSDAWKFNMANRFKWKLREDVTTNDEKVESPGIIIKQPNNE